MINTKYDTKLEFIAQRQLNLQKKHIYRNF